MLGRLVLIWLNRKVRLLVLCCILSLITRTTFYRLVNVVSCLFTLSSPLCTLSLLVLSRLILYASPFSFSRLEITIWVVPSLLENALSISCIGFLLGPMMPILMTYCTQILPKWLLTGCVGWIGGIGQAGSAILPFTTGLLASRFGIGSLQPL